MTPRSASPALLWIVALTVSLGSVLWVNAPRRARLERVTAVTQAAGAIDAASPTGYAAGTREFVVPERLVASRETIMLTQQMLAEGTWRVRHWDSDNAPFGREVRSSSLYPGWLALNAWIHHLLYDTPLGISVERVALHADPILHMLWLVAATLLAARLLGAVAAAVVALGGACVYPFAAGFMPGAPESHALGLALGTVGVLLMLGGRSDSLAPTDEQRRARQGGKRRPEVVTPPTGPNRHAWWIAAGIASGLGVWVNPQVQLPLLLGVALGGLAAAWLERGIEGDAGGDRLKTPPWRAWGCAGATVIAVGWLFEFFPAHLGTWDLRHVHVLHGVSWLGGAELLHQVARGLRGRTWRPKGVRTWCLAVLAAAGALALPLAEISLGTGGLFTVDALDFRLTKQIDGVIQPNLTAWLSASGWSLQAVAALSPLGVLALAGSALAVTKLPAQQRARIVLALGPALVAAALGYLHLRWWQLAGGCALLPLALVVSAREAHPWRLWRAGGFALAAAIILAGAAQLLPGRFLPDPRALSPAEAEGIAVRQLGQWLARRAGQPAGAIVLAPPSATSALCYHANLRGVASLSPKNKDGIGAAIRIAISTSRDETHALLQNREVRYLVLPSWDNYFDPFVQSASVQVGSLFLPGLQRWVVPPWLRPVPYEVPKLPGIERHSVVIFEMVEEQDEPLALARLAEYFIEMSQPQNAQATAEALRRFPADLGALVARAQCEAALGRSKESAETTELLLKRIAAGADRNLPFDRRVSLATVLARSQRFDAATTQVKRALTGVTADDLRSLTPYSLYHFLGLCRGFGLSIADPELRDLSISLLPVELRSRL